MKIFNTAKHKLGFVGFEPAMFTRSTWFKNQHVFLAFRCLLPVYCIPWLVVGILDQSQHHGFYHIYLSNWVEIFTNLYFIIAMFTAAATKRNERTLRLYHMITAIGLPVFFSANVTITALFWGMLAKEDTLVTALNIHRHGILGLLIFWDLLISDIPVRYFHFVFYTIFSFIYCVFTYVLHVTHHVSRFYTEVIDWEKDPKKTLITMLSAVLSTCVIYAIVPYAIFRIKVLIKKNCCGEIVANGDISAKETSRNDKIEQSLA